MSKQRLQRSELRFSCTGCGDCCSGDTGYVWVNDAELVAMAEAMQISPEDFSARYLRVVRRRVSLQEHPGGDCVLLDPVSRRCRVYEQRPSQCRSWPYWAENMVSWGAWWQAASSCPGIRIDEDS